MTPKQCRNAGHRWGRANLWEHKRLGIFVAIAVCQRKGCDRYRAWDDAGRVETYRVVEGHVVDKVIVARGIVAA